MVLRYAHLAPEHLSNGEGKQRGYRNRKNQRYDFATRKKELTTSQAYVSCSKIFKLPTA